MTLDEAADYLRERDDFLVLTHDGPDADGIGAAYALVAALRSIGKRAAAAAPDLLPHKFRFIDQSGLFSSLAAAPLAFEPHTVVVVDTHDRSYVGDMAEAMLEQAPEVLFIDHHEPRGERPDPALLESGASSSCELVFLLAERLGAVLPLDAAEALFAGIVYDTGSFAYPKTGESTFECARMLVRAGVRPYAIHNRMYESSSVGVLLLQKLVYSSLELRAGNRIALQRLGKAELVASGAAYEDAEDLVNWPLQSGNVEVSVLFKENAEGKLRCSLRSKGRVNVAHIAQSFGGGGHRTAAGFTCRSPLERAEADVLQTIVRALDELPAGGS